jgi:hypothetical protein
MLKQGGRFGPVWAGLAGFIWPGRPRKNLPYLFKPAGGWGVYLPPPSGLLRGL